ncbi:hypothetical protein BJ546DRAFT_211567 [Cryomyces antarcticus]
MRWHFFQVNRQIHQEACSGFCSLNEFNIDTTTDPKWWLRLIGIHRRFHTRIQLTFPDGYHLGTAPVAFKLLADATYFERLLIIRPSLSWHFHMKTPDLASITRRDIALLVAANRQLREKSLAYASLISFRTDRYLGDANLGVAGSRAATTAEIADFVLVVHYGTTAKTGKTLAADRAKNPSYCVYLSIGKGPLRRLKVALLLRFLE